MASSEYFNIGGTIQSTNTSLYLNVGDDSTSYKTLTFGKTASTNAWALEGDTIITSNGSPYGRRTYPSLRKTPFKEEERVNTDERWLVQN